MSRNRAAGYRIVWENDDFVRTKSFCYMLLCSMHCCLRPRRGPSTWTMHCALWPQRCCGTVHGSQGENWVPRYTYRSRSVSLRERRFRVYEDAPGFRPGPRRPRSVSLRHSLCAKLCAAASCRGDVRLEPVLRSLQLGRGRGPERGRWRGLSACRGSHSSTSQFTCVSRSCH